MLSYEEWLVELGRNLQRHRMDRGLTQARAAESCGLDLKYYPDIEYGRRPITTRTLFRVATAMKADLCALVPASRTRAARRKRRGPVVNGSPGGTATLAEGAPEVSAEAEPGE